MNKELTFHSNDISLANDISVTNINTYILLNAYKRHQILLNKLLLNTNPNINDISIKDTKDDLKFKALQKAELDLKNTINNDIMNLKHQLHQSDEIEPDFNEYTSKPIPVENLIQKVTIKHSGNVNEVQDSEKYFKYDVDEFYKKKQELVEIQKRKEQQELERKLFEQQQQIQYEQQKQKSQYEQQNQFSNMYNMDMDLNFGIKPDPISTMPDPNMLMNTNPNMFNPNMMMDPMMANPNMLKNNADSLHMSNINKPMMPSQSVYNTDPNINPTRMSNVNNDFLINDDFEFGDLGDLGNNAEIDDFNVDDLDPAFF